LLRGFVVFWRLRTVRRPWRFALFAILDMKTLAPALAARVSKLPQAAAQEVGLQGLTDTHVGGAHEASDGRCDHAATVQLPLYPLD